MALKSTLEIKFLEMFGALFKSGVGKPEPDARVRRAWEAKRFAETMGRNGCTVTKDAVYTWCNKKHLPREDAFLVMVKVFFPKGKPAEPDLALIYEDFLLTWESLKSQPRESDIVPATAPEQGFNWNKMSQIPKGEISTQEQSGSSSWIFPETEWTAGLAELRLHQPRTGNQLGTFYVDATLRVDTGKYELANQTIFIGLSDAFLAIETSGCQPARGTLIGERLTSENIRPKPRGVEFRARDGANLSGDLLGEEYIAVMEPTTQGKQSVTVELRAGRRSFNVSLERDDGSIVNAESAAKMSILNTLIFKMKEKDMQGRVVLAAAKMKRGSQQ